MSSTVPPSPSPSVPRPLQLVDGNVQSPLSSSFPPQSLAGLSTPPPSARKPDSRRHSSIAYYPSDHSPTWDLRSPTTAGPSSLKRSTSLNQKAPPRLDLKRDRRSLPAGDVLAVEIPQAVNERPPLTLTEKHADLLRFIAQKESKCLELRTQLAAHEAELAQLKRKWERIVSRGMDRAYSQQPVNPNAGSSSLLSGAVKDVSRLLTSGLGDLSTAPSSGSTPPLRTPVLKSGRVLGHANTQSTSSVSTSASLATSSVRLSQSSASSLAFDDPPCEQDEGDYDTSRSLKRTSMRIDGGTGIESPVEISPSTAIKAAKLHRRKSREVPAPPSPLTTASSISASTSAGFGSANGKDKERSGKDDGRRTLAKRASLKVGAAPGATTSASGLPPAASIPGLGPLASPLASTWMESVGSSVGKKWGEIQKGDTFTKSQKRASLLLSDAASSLFAALTSPSSPSLAPSTVSVSSNPFAASLSPLASSPSPTPSGRSAVSLLEDDDEGASAPLGSVLVPDSRPYAPKLAPVHQGHKSALDDDDEWNW